MLAFCLGCWCSPFHAESFGRHVLHGSQKLAAHGYGFAGVLILAAPEEVCMGVALEVLSIDVLALCVTLVPMDPDSEALDAGNRILDHSGEILRFLQGAVFFDNDTRLSKRGEGGLALLSGFFGVEPFGSLLQSSQLLAVGYLLALPSFVQVCPFRVDILRNLCAPVVL